jgi:hypothetical protein
MEKTWTEEEAKGIAEILQAKLDSSEIKYNGVPLGYDEFDLPGNEYGACSKCGEHIGYHDDIPYLDFKTVRNRLNRADPGWWWEPVAISAQGQQEEASYFLDRKGEYVMLIKLHVGPFVKIGTGSADNPEGCIKNAITFAASLLGVDLP